jgi:hypothetical protein
MNEGKERMQMTRRESPGNSQPTCPKRPRYETPTRPQALVPSSMRRPELLVPPLHEPLAEHLEIPQHKEQHARVQVGGDALEPCLDGCEEVRREGAVGRGGLTGRGDEGEGGEEVTFEELGFVEEEGEGLNVRWELGIWAGGHKGGRGRKGEGGKRQWAFGS